MAHEVVEVQLTPEERALILEYGYPFECIEQAINSCQGSNAIELVPLDAFELEQLIAQLCISINEITGGAVQDQLLHLCDRLEAAERYGEGMLDEL